MREHPAVGITEHKDVGARFGSSAQGLERVFGVGNVPVEEVLGVVHDVPAICFQVRNRRADQLQVFFERHPEGHLGVKRPAFSED